MPKYERSNNKTSAKRRLDFDDDSGKDNDNPVVVLDDVEPPKKKLKEPPSVIPATPERKRRRRETKQGISTYFSPVKLDAKKATVVVTPEKKEEPETREEPAHVPIYIHKNLNYQRRGQASLSDKRKRVFELVEEHCLIPPDFENNRKYGPLSGTCFEERAIDAYEKGLLNQSGVQICTYCATVGHEQDECEELI